MKTYIYILFALLFAVTGCIRNTSSPKQTADSEDSLDAAPLYIDLENIHKTDSVDALLSADASEIIYIPLETNDNSLIQSIGGVRLWGDHILVSEFQNLCLFDKSGKFIQKISRPGGGPEDYNRVSNIITDPETGMLYIFSINKVIKFDKNVKYVGSYTIKNEEYFNGGIMTPDKNFLSYFPNRVRLLGDTAKVFNLMETDTLGNVMKYYENTEPRYAAKTGFNITMAITPLYVHDGNVRFLEFGCDTLFTVHKDSMKPYAVLDLGEMKMNHTPDVSAAQSFEASRPILEALTKYLYISKIHESDQFIYMDLKWGFFDSDKGNLFCIYDKETKTVSPLKNKGLQNDLDGGISFFPLSITENGDMIAWKSAEEFKEEILSKDYDAQKAKYGERFEKVYQLAQSLKEDDNPVLIITKK